MKRLFPTPIFYLLMVLAIVGGCSKKEDAKEGDRKGAVQTIVFKHFKPPGEPRFFLDLIERFERENPNIKVKDEILPASTDEQHQYYVINLEGRAKEFDVFALDVIWVQEFIRAGWLLDLTPYIGAQGLRGMLPGPVSAVTFKGKIYAIPWFMDAGLLYYRRDLLKKYNLTPPQTFAELINITRTVLQAERDPGLLGFIFQGKQYEGLICSIMEFIWGNGGDVISADGQVVIDSQEAGDALAFVRDLIYKHKLVPELVTTADEEITRHIFGAGRAVFMRNWPYAWNLFQRADSPVKGKVGITLMPHFQGKESAATLGGWQLGINPYSRNVDAAVTFVKFMTRYDSQRHLALTMGLKPTLVKLYQDPDLVASQPFITELLPVMLRARPRPVTPFYMMISQILQAEFSAVISGIRPPNKALASARKQIERILELERP
ncbi:MAG: ABC transporter substrate-binding protein [Thermodesulfobacteriota bacterium]